MNILLITSISGFLPKFLMKDVENLQALGYTVHYASNFKNPVYECDREELKRKGILCYHVPISKNPMAVRDNHRAYRQLRKIVRKKDIQVVYCHNPMGGALGRLLTFAEKDLFVIYTAHGFHFYKGAPLKNWLLYYPIERILAKRTDILITINHEDYDRAMKFKLNDRGMVYRIPSIGLDSVRFQPDYKNRARIRKKLEVKEDEFVFLSVGELNDNKNHITIMRAFEILLDRLERNAQDSTAKIKNAKLFICGRGENRPELDRWIVKHNLEGRIVLWGYQTRIEKFYQGADCFLFPSYREGMGMAALEAMACGLPLIAAKNRGTREYAFPSNSLVCEPGDATGFANAMEQMMTDAKLLRTMVENGRERATYFDAKCTAEVMNQIYERMRKELERK